MEKKRVEIYSFRHDNVHERLLLTDEQLRLLDLLERGDYFADDICIREVEEDIVFREV